MMIWHGKLSLESQLRPTSNLMNVTCSHSLLPSRCHPPSPSLLSVLSPPHFKLAPPLSSHIFVCPDCEDNHFKVQFLFGISGPERMVWSTVYLTRYALLKDTLSSVVKARYLRKSWIADTAWIMVRAPVNVQVSPVQRTWCLIPMHVVHFFFSSPFLLLSSIFLRKYYGDWKGSPHRMILHIACKFCNAGAA
ncbi:hypothetical protein L873DRAFT_324197 [Choiromyces venosus 120613-1]|uniref:Uncharacterized protein n=1 Tax=Choiromyces venosus 120613-1 TaxID=1336337 RepID=A0A3N4K0Z4_9PEZI|nr:hypothetical protein L873DRAFT_324197 [Choiromyces venosus 120613-1]